MKVVCDTPEELVIVANYFDEEIHLSSIPQLSFPHTYVHEEDDVEEEMTFDEFKAIFL